MLDIGLRLGLAADMQYDKRIQDLRYNEEADRRAKEAAEAKAKVFADDFNYTNAANTHDNPLIKQFAQFQIKRIGKYINENPDWQSNVEKRAQYTQLVRELKDNPDLQRGVATDDAFKKMNEYSKDSKNQHIVNSEDWKKIDDAKRNYLLYGNQDGEEAAKKEGKKAFTFVPPEEAVSTSSALIEAARNVQFDQINNYGYDGHKKSISSTQKSQAVEMMLADDKWGKYLKKDYDKYLSQFIGNEKTNAKTINEFTLERMDPYFSSEQIEIGHTAPTIKADTSSATMSSSLWNEMHQKALNEAIKNKKPTYVEFNPQAMQMTFGNKYGEAPLNNVVTPFGEPVNLGMRDVSFTGLSAVYTNPKGLLEAKQKVFVRLPIEDFYSLGGKYSNVIDEGGIGQITPGGPKNSADNWSIHDKYKDDFKKYTDKSGRNLVEFAVDYRYDPSNPNLAINYANAHNAKAQADNSYYGTQQKRIGVDEAGNKFYLDENNNPIAPVE